jgi:hypothetical protein
VEAGPSIGVGGCEFVNLSLMPEDDVAPAGNFGRLGVPTRLALGIFSLMMFDISCKAGSATDHERCARCGSLSEQGSRIRLFE